MICRLEEMTWLELDRLPRSRTLVIVPIGPIEEHGPHLPLGTDVMAAADIAEATARTLSERAPDRFVILSPAVPLGCAAVTADFPGTLSLKGTTFQAVIRDLCNAWVRQGFTRLLLVNHHLDPIHMKALLSAIEAIEAEHDARIAETMSRSVYAGLENEAVTHGRRLGLDMRYEVHADAKETAYIRYRRPELFIKDAAPLAPVLIDVRKGMREGRATFREMGADLGYIGTPEQSDPAFGRLHLEACVRQAVDLALKLINDAPLPPIDPRILAFLADHVRLA